MIKDRVMLIKPQAREFTSACGLLIIAYNVALNSINRTNINNPIANLRS